MTNQGPITQEELRTLFGDNMPIEAVTLIFDTADNMTLRARLRELAGCGSSNGEQGMKDKMIREALQQIKEQKATIKILREALQQIRDYSHSDGYLIQAPIRVLGIIEKMASTALAAEDKT
jgi:hypothetical protein